MQSDVLASAGLAMVMDPLLFLEGVTDPGKRGSLEAWRDGRYRIVLTRRMMAHLLGLLRGTGLSEALLRRWAIWLTDPVRVVLLTDGIQGRSLREEYVDAARRGGAAAILTSRPEDFESANTEGLPVRQP